MKMRVLNSDEKNGQGKLEQQRYRGVRKRKWGKYVSEIRLPNSRERIWLGSYETAEKAARAFDAAIYCLRGRNANFNFPHDPPDIAGGRSLDAAQIQLVAAQFANEAPPPLPEAVLPVKDSSASDCMSPLSSVSEAPVESCSFFDSLPPLMAEIALDESQFGVFSSQFDDFGSDILFPPIPEADYIDGAETGYYQLSSLWNF